MKFLFLVIIFYENWNKVNEVDLIEFILPQENIEIIQLINKNKKDLIELNLNTIFKEYSNNNLAVILIEDNNTNNIKAYIKSKIQEKNISKSFKFKKQNLMTKAFYEKIIIDFKKELINLVKAENLIDIRTRLF